MDSSTAALPALNDHLESLLSEAEVVGDSWAPEILYDFSLGLKNRHVGRLFGLAGAFR